jgi:hypothetical protein
VERFLDPPAGGLDLGIVACGNLGDGEEVREALDGSLHVASICLGNGSPEDLGGAKDESSQKNSWRLAADRRQLEPLKWKNR